MAKQTAKTIEELINEFIERVKSIVRVEAAYWFGSTSTGVFDEYSDIDIAIISPDFTGRKFEDACKIFPIIAQPDPRIEVHSFTPETFRESFILGKQIRQTGKRVA